MAFAPLHSTIGISICKLIPNPYISLPISFFSHILLDLYPEWTPSSSGIKSIWDFNNYTWKEFLLLIIQCFLAGFIISYLIMKGNWVLFTGAILANLMDMWDFLWEKITGDKFWSHHGGWFPFRKTFSWQGQSMRALNNVVLDAIFIVIIITLLWIIS